MDISQMNQVLTGLASIIDANAGRIRERWHELLAAGGTARDGRMLSAELETQCADFLTAFSTALHSGNESADTEPFAPLRALLSDISRSRAIQGFSPTETATFIFSLKEPLFEQLRAAYPEDVRMVGDAGWKMSQVIDQLGLYTMEVYQKSREEIVRRQQDEIAELSTPVVKLWDGILALPLIGTLDSARTQVVMENLLQAIVDQSADLAIIDITGVPTVDTLVAQHLLKTVAAAKLMGADCIISGIRPQIAQTMVHLGVELNVASKATLADALSLAFQRTGRTVVRKARG